MAEHMAVPGGSRGALALKRWVANSHLSIIPVSQDDTLFAKIDGVVKFSTKNGRKLVNVIPK